MVAASPPGAGRVPLLVLFLLSLVLAGGAGLAQASSPELFALEDLRPGMRGLAYSVFAGDSISEFPVEVIDRLPGQGAHELVLVRCLGPEAERSGVSQGMSGSPVYIDGRWLGAIAYNYSYAREALAMVTPAAAMLALAERPDRRRAEGGDQDLGALLGLSEPGALPALTGLQLSVGGLSPGRLGTLAEAWSGCGASFLPMGAMAPTGAGGRADPAELAASLQPGSALGVLLLRGPISTAAIGTLTHREGDRVWGFGHPFLGEGPSALPLAAVRIHSVLPSLVNSYKLGSVLAPLGTLRQDGKAGIFGTLGEVPELLPLHMSLALASGETHVAEFEMARHEQLQAILGRIAIDGWLPIRLDAMATGRLDLQVQLFPGGALRRKAPVVLSQSFAGKGAVKGAGPWFQSLLDLLARNPRGSLPLDSLAVALRWTAGAEATRLVDLQLGRTALRPGEDWPLGLRLQRGDGPSEHLSRRFPTRFPSVAGTGVSGNGDAVRTDEASAAPMTLLSFPAGGLAPGDYRLHVADGASFERWNAKRQPALYRFEDHAGLLDMLAGLKSSEQWVAWLEAAGHDQTGEGREFSLPAYYRVLKSKSGRERAEAGKKPRRLIAFGELDLPAALPAQGHLAHDVQILPPPPLGGRQRSQP